MGPPGVRGAGEGPRRRRRLAPVLTGLLVLAVGLELLYVLAPGPPDPPDPPGPPSPAPGPPALHLLLGLYQMLNLLVNAGRFLRSDPGIRGVMLAGRGLGQGWEYCYQCQSQVPPRSGHCTSCRVCILRKDHHCLLLGRCVGFRNYRPFLCLLLHGAAALAHAGALLGPALAALLRAQTPLRAITLLLMPWLMLLTGSVSPAQFALAFVTDMCVAGALLCGAGLLFHGALLLRGQTTGEWARGQRAYDLGPRGNLRAALGPRWALVWLWPFVRSPLPGDGVVFPASRAR
ncbi:probable palmitoyltransferase ZDHHC24 [Tachyglossus aculeatus]|uniref:probable palmitoyltransferase ZDHHC24 n=1 Tax=Tachyglossus aculeatus TaxID=9261 RepID=UPI0018F3EBD0|nr:probable palmitoyltransferase ZDHHC24 [Tachyglossus aculeatus]